MPATLSNLMHGTVDWLRDHPAIGTLVFVAPIVIFIVSVWVAYRFMLAIPADYFAQKHKRLDPWRDSHPALRYTVLVVKNVVGAVLIVLGLIMLVTPGQGLLSLLIGLSLVDIPGKQALQRRIIQRKEVLRVVNHLRRRAGKPPLEF
ncbi:MAG: PGPGW domain-containing protein [Pirellulales bacterium]